MTTTSDEIVIAILAKNTAFSLDKYLECIYNQNYPKDKLHLYIKENDSTDNTSEILSEFIKNKGSEYNSV